MVQDGDNKRNQAMTTRTKLLSLALAATMLFALCTMILAAALPIMAK